MRQLAYALPQIPGFDSLRPKTYAAWPVWKDSTTDEVRFVPLWPCRNLRAKSADLKSD
jgi:hypothetical protein